MHVKTSFGTDYCSLNSGVVIILRFQSAKALRQWIRIISTDRCNWAQPRVPGLHLIDDPGPNVDDIVRVPRHID